MHDISEATTHADIQAAIARAHTLRSQAMTDGLRSLGRWLFRFRTAQVRPATC